MRFLRTTTIPSADEDEDARREEQQRESEEQIAATLSNIQLSRGVEELVDGEEFTEEDVEQLEEVLDGCDNEYLYIVQMYICTFVHLYFCTFVYLYVRTFVRLYVRTFIDSD